MSQHVYPLYRMTKHQSAWGQLEIFHKQAATLSFSQFEHCVRLKIYPILFLQNFAIYQCFDLSTSPLDIEQETQRCSLRSLFLHWLTESVSTFAPPEKVQPYFILASPFLLTLPQHVPRNPSALMQLQCTLIDALGPSISNPFYLDKPLGTLFSKWLLHPHDTPFPAAAGFPSALFSVLKPHPLHNLIDFMQKALESIPDDEHTQQRYDKAAEGLFHWLKNAPMLYIQKSISKLLEEKPSSPFTIRLCSLLQKKELEQTLSIVQIMQKSVKRI